MKQHVKVTTDAIQHYFFLMKVDYFFIIPGLNSYD